MYARAYDCPNCGAAVPFPSAIAVYAVCAHCRSGVVRRDAGDLVELMGQQAQLPPDISPIQIGTRGEYDGRPFTILGRVRLGYAEGSWNEWCADFGEGHWGWVAEAAGRYMVSFEVAPPEDLPGLAESRAAESPGGPFTLLGYRLSIGRNALPLDRRITIAGVDYVVRDVKQTEVLVGEGALPFAAVTGRGAISGDLGAPGRAFANVEFSEQGVRVFVGHHRTFEELRFSGLRPLPGWTTDRLEKEAAGSEALNCPSCGAAIVLRAAGLSMAAGCPNCAAVLDTSHPVLRVLSRAEAAKHQTPAIPIGRRGRWRGTEYECVGFMKRRDGGGYSWAEYLLFNPFDGFRWLVEYEGHWNFVESLMEAPRLMDGAPTDGDRSYRLFSRGMAHVSYVLGEFYWSVRLRERTEVVDHIAPPYVLSSERYPDLREETWSRGEYVEPAEVHAAFGLTAIPRERAGVYLNQPNPHAEKGRTLRWLFPLFAAAWLLISIVVAGTKANERAFGGRFVYDPGSTNRTVVSEPFHLGGTHPQALAVRLDAPVSQGWFGAGIDLVDEKTREVRDFEIGAEYWSGVSDGEAWSEGSGHGEELVPAVPPGDYRLVIDMDGSVDSGPLEFGIVVVRDVMVWSNMVLAILALLAYPVFRWFREHAFERERWYASDHSPYTPVSEMFAADSDDD